MRAERRTEGEVKDSKNFGERNPVIPGRLYVKNRYYLMVVEDPGKIGGVFR